MPVSIVVGGQFGSEGKGKVALELVRRSTTPTIAVRVGGPNSGHTAYDRQGARWQLRQLPAACVDRNIPVVIGPGSYLDVDMFFEEIEALRYPSNLISVSPCARIIEPQHKAWEAESGLSASIGSTGSGVGAAVIAAVGREAAKLPLISRSADEEPRLARFIDDTTRLLRQHLNLGRRVVVEGTQGFGLSLLQGGYWPKVTSRETTAASALAEAGLSPIDVDEVVLVIRTYPIRVAGDSGPLINEISWAEIAARAGISADIREYTTATKRLRRVGEFDPNLVKCAISANNPTKIVLNHVDYIGILENSLEENEKISRYIESIERSIGRKVDFIGFSPDKLVEFSEIFRV